MEKQKSQFYFIEDKIKEIKQEIKDRKKWKTALYNEYCKARTIKYHREMEIIRMIHYADIMIKYNQFILQEYTDMLKQLNKIEKKKY